MTRGASDATHRSSAALPRAVGGSTPVNSRARSTHCASRVCVCTSTSARTRIAPHSASATTVLPNPVRISHSALPVRSTDSTIEARATRCSSRSVPVNTISVTWNFDCPLGAWNFVAWNFVAWNFVASFVVVGPFGPFGPPVVGPFGPPVVVGPFGPSFGGAPMV